MKREEIIGLRDEIAKLSPANHRSLLQLIHNESGGKFKYTEVQTGTFVQCGSLTPKILKQMQEMVVICKKNHAARESSDAEYLRLTKQLQ